MLGTGERPRCRHHLGRRPALLIAEHRAEQQALELLRQQQATARQYGAADLIDPLQSLHELADEVWSWKEACRALVGHLEELRYRASSGEQLRSEIAVYERSLDRAAKILADLVRLGIEDRMVKLAERQVTAVGRAVESALTELAPMLEFDGDDPRIRPVIARHLRGVER